MERRTKLFSLLLSLALIAAVFSGCGSQTAESTAAASSAQTTEVTASAPEPAATPEPEIASVSSAEESTMEEAEPPAPAYTISYPLEGDDMELTYWMPFKSPHESIQTFDEFPVLATAEKLTGVKVSFTSENMMTASEKFNLMVASGDYCDLLGGALSYYTGNYNEAIADGIAIDLSGMIEEFAPDYYAMLTADENNYKAAVDDDGVMIAIYTIKDQYFPVMGGTVIRQDWMDALGYKSIDSIDQMDDFLRDCKSTYGAGYPLMLTYSNYENILSAAYGIGGGDCTNGLYQVDGDVRYTYVQPEYKEYLKLAAAWYQDGIIGSDFMNVGTTGLPMETYTYVYSGDTAIIGATAAEIASIEAETGNGCKLIGFNYPASDGSGVTHFTDMSMIKSSEHALITEQCAHPEIALEWLNYWFTEYGAIVANYGTEGESFTFDENGDPQWTDLITANEYDLPANRASAIYTLYAHTTPIHTMETRLSSTFTQEQKDVYDVWMTGIDGNNLLPAVSLTKEESETARSPLADIQTYVDENVAKFINGTRSLDEFDDFVADIEGMGLADIIEVYQAALERYNQRAVG